MNLPKPISRLIENFERLPGIGPKTAQRLVFHLLHFPKEDLENFGENLVRLKNETILCSVCKNVGDKDPCDICRSAGRDKNVIAVVAGPLDVYALERAHFKGQYHVLHGLIDPLNSIGPDDIFVKELLVRIREFFFSTVNDTSDSAMSFGFEDGVKQLEVILSTNSSMEGESTSMYISKMIRDAGHSESQVKITRIARGLPVGGDIEYADDHTLLRALEGRVSF